MLTGVTVQHDDDGIVVNVPLMLKKRGGRKEVILPQAFASDSPVRPSHQEALVIAIARAHRWQKLLDEGKFTLDEPISNRAMHLTPPIGVDRITCYERGLSPHPVGTGETVQYGGGMSGLSFLVALARRVDLSALQK